ncbi:hypothetical protein Pyn_17043 [Prunus yedoensis var. nudiflora]|uniref:Uncharacterized protein n=1 Tax=Prunus yedoensis var. nudiflora TaxID=2094558 RepID=A0A314ZDM3_PRUYE|nr:hypothetical protein Pyn_17043 [Prunus yedoensis var. nudiflora]
MSITYQAHMNPSHVVYEVCMRDCGMEGYGGPQGPHKLLDNGDFGLATWEHQRSTKVQAHYLEFSNAKSISLGCCKPLSNHDNSSSFFPLAAASIPVINLYHLAAASILAAIDQHLLVAQAS